MKKNNWWRLPIGILTSIVYLSPFYILLSVAFRKSSDMSSRWHFPTYFNLDNFKYAFQEGHIQHGIIDSMVITFCSVVLIVIVGACAAYPLARNRSKLNKVIKGFVLGVMMVPPLSILVPIYSIMKNIHGISTFWGIILLLVTFSLPMSIFIFTNFIVSIPIALDEAASIDGCGPLQLFFRIILPQLKPVVASVVILTGVSSWNDYQFSLYMLQKPTITSVTLAVSGFFAQVSSNVYAAASAAILGVLPVVVLFLVLQKYFIKGMIDSAIK